jgi:CheY-like chemotaxis protein
MPGGEPQAGSRPGPDVLLAVAHPRIRALLERHLGSIGCRVVLADSAARALDEYRRLIADSAPPAVAIVDQALADHDGQWLAARIHELQAPPPGLILLRPLTAAGTDLDRSLFDRIINKPVKTRMLARALAELTQARAVPGPDLPAPSSSPVLRPGLRVLLADDNLVNQKVAAYLLKKLGANVRSVGNGSEALQALREEDFDVVLMDCQMPDMDGYETTRRLRQAGACRNPRIPVIALTANAFATDRERCLAAGMDDFLTKPIERERLEGALIRVLGEPGPADRAPHFTSSEMLTGQ